MIYKPTKKCELMKPKIGQVIYDMASGLTYYESNLPTRCFECKYEWKGTQYVYTELCSECDEQ